MRDVTWTLKGVMLGRLRNSSHSATAAGANAVDSQTHKYKYKPSGGVTADERKLRRESIQSLGKSSTKGATGPEGSKKRNQEPHKIHVEDE